MAAGISVKYEPKLNVFISCWSATRQRQEEYTFQKLRETHRMTYAMEDENSMGNYVSTRADNG